MRIWHFNFFLIRRGPLSWLTKGVGRIEGGASEGCLGGAALANVAQEPNTASPTPSDLDASHSQSPVSSSLVDEIMGAIHAYAECSAHRERFPTADNARIRDRLQETLRSRLTALETELTGYRVRAAMQAEAIRTQPATTITVSHPINQCDGCQRGLPIVNGIHRGASPFDMIGCTAHLYRPSPNTTEKL